DQLFCHTDSSGCSHLKGTSLRYAIDFNYGAENDDLGYPVLAMAAGKVIYATCSEPEPMVEHGTKSAGCMVILSHSYSGATDVERSRYMHLTTITVEVNDLVDQGQQIGVVGNTGNTKNTRSDGSTYYAAHIHVDVPSCLS
ncbi:hypothetical protein COV21_03120, partial [Candidatus Woesearchaeota archaeon CG10_big_fil_rev_8_21_14_0_10_45_5]